MIKAKLVYSTNQAMSDFYGIVGDFEIENVARWSGSLRGQIFHTTGIVEHELSGSMLRIQTLNSIYLFEIVDGEFEPSTIVQAPKELIDEHNRRNATRYQTYWCQIAGDALIHHGYSIVRLPRPMSLQEARDHAASGTLLDVHGNVVCTILAAKEN